MIYDLEEDSGLDLALRDPATAASVRRRSHSPSTVGESGANGSDATTTRSVPGAGPSGPLFSPSPLSPTPSGSRRGQSRLRAAVVVTGTLAGLAIVWELIKLIGDVPDARLPQLWSILAFFGSETAAGQREYLFLASNIATTFEEAVVGLLLAVVVGGVLGVLTAKRPWLGKGVTPLLVMTQTLPIVAIAPALVIWLGQSWTSKAVIAALIAFFPIAVSSARGVRDIPEDQILSLRSFGASRRALLFRLELPSALTQANSAIPTAAALAVVGAVVAELSVGTGNGIAVVLLGAAGLYTVEPSALWCAALVTALCGIVVVYSARVVFAHCARLVLHTTYLPSGAV